eukprot:XP_027323330.1 uncharacterized protein LOC106017218 isoform X3 [Anas platyrhynchos]
MQVAIHPGYFLPIHCKLVQNECLIETHKERHLSFWSFPMLIAALVVFTDIFFCFVPLCLYFCMSHRQPSWLRTMLRLVPVAQAGCKMNFSPKAHNLRSGMIHGLKDVFQEIMLYLSKEENVDVKNFSAFLGSCQFCGLAHVLPQSCCIPRHQTCPGVASKGAGRAAVPSQLPGDQKHLSSLPALMGPPCILESTGRKTLKSLQVRLWVLHKKEIWAVDTRAHCPEDPINQLTCESRFLSAAKTSPCKEELALSFSTKMHDQTSMAHPALLEERAQSPGCAMKKAKRCFCSSGVGQQAHESISVNTLGKYRSGLKGTAKLFFLHQQLGPRKTRQPSYVQSLGSVFLTEEFV